MNNRDFYWLVGLLEGEGNFRFLKSPIIRLTMTDEDVVRRAAGLMNGTVRNYRRKEMNRQDVWAVGIYGDNALNLMKKLLQEMGIRRQEKIRNVMKEAEKRPGVAWGERQTNSKIKLAWIPLIRELAKRGISQRKLSEMCGVSQTAIYCVVNNKTWKQA